MRHLKYFIWLMLCVLAFLDTARAAVTYSSAATTFNWITPAAPSTAVWTSGAACSSGYAGAPVDDDITAQLPLGFTFNFGGVNYTTVQIMSNGRLQFGNGYCGAGTNWPGTQVPRTYPFPFPNASLLRTMKVYAADIDLTAGGSVTYAAIGTAPNRQFVVTWTNAPEWDAGNGSGANSYFNLQVILNENGDFIFQYGASNNTSHGNAQIGWGLTTTDYALVAYPPDTSTTPGPSSSSVGIGTLTNTAIRFFIPAMLANYQLDESAWAGAGSIINSASASFNASPSGAAASTASGYQCRGASIPLNTAKGTIDGIDTGIPVAAKMGSAGAVDFWYNARTAWNDGVDRMLLDATANNSAPFFLIKRADGSLRFVLQDSTNTIFATAGGAHNFAANTWHHIAITWSMGAIARMTIYLDGAVDKQFNPVTSGALSSLIGALFVGDNRGKAVSNSPTDNSANGIIDELRVYNYEIPSTVVNRDRSASHSCNNLNNFLINAGAASASTCTAKRIQITARDAANATLTGYIGSIMLNTSSGHGDWSKITANGTLNAGAADSGAATYSFAAADNGTITLGLTDSHADNLTVTASDASAGVSATSTTINFLDNVFVITEDPIQVAGRDQAMSAALWRKDSSTGTCSIATTYSRAKALKAWLARDVSDPGGAAPTISGVALPNARPASTDVTLTFSSGAANFTMATSDVGKYALNLLDDSRTFAGVNILGASNLLTTRPFGLAFTNIKLGATLNPGGANATDAVFGGAGAAFQATVGAYLWQATDDANNDGVPDAGATITDNGLTPTFAWPVTLSSVLNTPSGGVAGTLGGTTSIAQTSFLGGTATVIDLTYSEVGSMKLSAAASNYLNTGAVNLNASSGVVGRFVPDHFATSALVNGSLGNGCGTFTYSGQQSGGRGAIRYLTAPQFTIAAQNAANGVTQNYTGAFAKLLASGISITSPTTDATQNGADKSTKLTLKANLATGTLTPVSGANGTFTYVLGDDDFAYLHDGNARVGPFTSAIFLDIAAVKEPVNDNVAANDLPKTLKPAGVEIRFGRLALQNAYGSELLPLPINLTAEYWADLDGAGPGTDFGFIPNAADNCTTVAAGNVTLTPSTLSSLSPVASNPFSAGNWHNETANKYTQLQTPTGPGAVDIMIDLDAATVPWLKYDWDGIDQGGDGNFYDDNPSARAVFGIFKGPDRRIYLRERFN